jgi:ketosteroid isomerase-like protein
MSVIRLLAGLVLLAPALLHVGAESRALPVDPAFAAFLREFEQGTERFINGDATLWKANASRRDDVTLMGGWGIVARGWKEVGSRYDWAAARFRDSGATLNVEYASIVAGGDFACTVAVERSTVRLVDRPTSSPMVLRVTHVFRREDGRWRLVHRHADPIMETTTPGSVLSR